MEEFKIQFSVSGTVTQTIVPTSDKFTQKEIIEGLNSGKFATTLHGNKPKITIVLTGEVIADIINIDNECEYTDFDTY